MADLRDILRSRINLEAEFEEMLGPPHYKNGDERKFRCWNTSAHKNGDSTPALMANMKTGFWTCPVCMEKGDFWGLWAIKNGMDPKRDFGRVLARLGEKYGVKGVHTLHGAQVSRGKSPVGDAKTTASKGVDEGVNPGTPTSTGIIMIPKDHKDFQSWLNKSMPLPCNVLERLQNNYGIVKATAESYYLGYANDRLWIPIPVREITKGRVFQAPIVSIRKHDILRKHCDSDGKYRKYGKIIGVKGYNPVYLFPITVLEKYNEVWVVGGELKAIMLNQFGIPAVSWTNGEGRYNRHILKLFATKTVRVVMDVDDAGERATFGWKDTETGEEHAGLAKILADAGAEVVYGGRIPPEGLPSNGDITDFMRLNHWDPSCLKRIMWTKIERAEIPFYVDDDDDDNRVVLDAPEFGDLSMSKFEDMLTPMNSDKWLKLQYIVAGRSETPALLPTYVDIICEAGSVQGDVYDACEMCPCKAANYCLKFHIPALVQLQMVGMPTERISQLVHRATNMPKCNRPTYHPHHDAVDTLVVTPTLDPNSAGDQFNYRQHRIHVLGGEAQVENSSYEVVGKVVSHPKDATFSFVVAKSKRMENDSRNFRFDQTLHDRLHRFVWSHDAEDIADAINNIKYDLREHTLFKYGMDKLIIAELLAFFMPFRFKIGRFEQFKICPEVCVIGDTRVGKSSAAKQLMRHYAAGRYLECGGVSSAGLVGGNSQSSGKNSMFVWGVIPMSNGTLCVIDEAQKLPSEVIESLTSLRSTGVAERTTISGPRKIAANVRILWLCNPRNSRDLSSYSDPVRAVVDVFGTPQDTARLDFIHAQYEIKDPRVTNSIAVPDGEREYTEELARYHLRWAWSLNESDIVFECGPQYILDRAIELIEMRQKAVLFPVAETKFKLARIAAGIASICYNVSDSGRLVVGTDEIDYAFNLLTQPIGSNETIRERMKCPVDIGHMFDSLGPKTQLLKFFLIKNLATTREIKDLFNNDQFVTALIQRLGLEMGLFVSRGKYWAWDVRMVDIVSDYLRIDETQYNATYGSDQDPRGQYE